MKKRLEDDFFSVLQFTLDPITQPVPFGSSTGSIKDVLLHDTLSRLVEGDEDSMQVAVVNVYKFVEHVHHSRYSVDLLKCKCAKQFEATIMNSS